MIDFAIAKKTRPVGAVDAGSPDSQAASVRVVTVRMSAAMHEQLIATAHDVRCSLNRFCLLSLDEGRRQAQEWVDARNAEACGAETNKGTATV